MKNTENWQLCWYFHLHVNFVEISNTSEFPLTYAIDQVICADYDSESKFGGVRDDFPVMTL